MFQIRASPPPLVITQPLSTSSRYEPTTCGPPLGMMGLPGDISVRWGLTEQQHPWTTAHGSEEMISKDDNLYYVGQQVLEPTPEELGLAIRPLKGIL